MTANLDNLRKYRRSQYTKMTTLPIILRKFKTTATAPDIINQLNTRDQK